MRSGRLVRCILVAVAASGCAAFSRMPSPGAGRRGERPEAPLPAREAAIASLPAQVLGTLAEGARGPFLGSSPSGRLAVWLAPDGIYALAIDHAGAPQGRPRRIGPTPAEVGLVAVRASDDAGGFLLLTSSGGDGAGRIAAQGVPAGSPAVLVEGASRVLWMEVVVTRGGPVLFWADLDAGAARLSSRALDRSGAPRGPAHVLATRAIAWQATRLGDGVALGWVEGREGASQGSVALVQVTADGAARAAPLVVSESPTALPDLDLTASDETAVLAWSDTRDDDPAVYTAAVDAAGRVVRPPHRATGTFEPEALVRLVPPLAGGPAYLAWEPLGERPERGRVVRLAALEPNGRAGASRAELAIDSGSVLPEFVATSKGLAALTLAPACPRSAAEAHPGAGGGGSAAVTLPESLAAGLPRAILGECDAPALPLYVAFDRDLRVTVAEPLRLDLPTPAAADAAWGLSCLAQGCITLAAASGAPTPIYAVRLASVSAHWRAPARALPRVLPPRPLGARSLASLAPLADVAAVPFGGGVLGAWVTYFDPGAPWVVPKQAAPDGRFAPVQATLQVLRVDAAKAEPTTLSIRARSPGGVAVAPAAGRDEALVVWTAMDQGRPQVFGTTVGARAQKLAQKMLTATPGEKGDVAVAWVGDGWMVGWIDERAGAPSPYVARFDPSLRRIGAERALSSGGGATGIALAVAGDAVQVVWAEARDPALPGVADVFGARVSARDGAPLAEAARLAATATHSFAPALAMRGAAPVLAWLEAADSGSGAAAAVKLVELDAAMRFTGPATTAAVAGRSPTGLALSCDASVCHVAVAVDTGTAAAVEAFAWQGGIAVAPRRLATIAGPAGQVVPLAWAGEELFLADQPETDRGRVRALTIEW